MLSRVAENLFWIGRYAERAENIARLADAARRMVTLPEQFGRSATNEWSSVLIAAGARDRLGEDIETAGEDVAIGHLIFDDSNPSSVRNCFKRARENARAVRATLTQESWEALNTAWREMRDLSAEDARGAKLLDVLDWIKAKSAIFRGSTHGTMLRGDGHSFVRMGVAIERIDSTARLLDVKYHVLLPSVDDVGSVEDHYQWLSLLQAASAQRAYFFATQSDVTAKGVAEFLILNQRFPRSIVFNLILADEAVKDLETFYGQPSLCRDPIRQSVIQMSSLTIDQVFESGLHEFLTDVIEQNARNTLLLAAAYGFAPITEEEHGLGSDSGQ
ncbi:MAG: alpha-E domain-containing protein [Pseudomonadota bacterium]